MSLLQQLGAQLTATADELPLAPVALAAERLRAATDLLMWVRQESANPLAVPQLSNATEHLEQAGYALRVCEDALREYLAAIGLGYAAAVDVPVRGGDDRPAPPPRAGTGNPARTPVPAPLARWWTERVNQLTDRADAPPDRPEQRAGAATTSDDLLRRVAAQVRAGDREQLRRELGRAEAPVGLGMAALTPLIVRRLATDLLGHSPGPADLPALARQTSDGVRRLVPRLPDGILATLLARACRTPPPRQPPAHPADSAVAGAVLAGLLSQRLGRDPDSLASGADG